MFGIWGVVLGVILGAFGIFMVFFFPHEYLHQSEEFGITGIVMGIISLIASFFLIFF